LLQLLLSIYNVQRTKDEANSEETRQSTQEGKRRRLLNGTAVPGARKRKVPLLLAPDRVLQYVALSLEGVDDYCIPISLQRRDFTAVVSGHLSALARETSDERRGRHDHTVVPTTPNHLKQKPIESGSSPSESSSIHVPTVLTLDKVRVDHCPHSYGFVLAIDRPAALVPRQSISCGNDPYRPFLLCYSGDTRPCEDLVRACQFWSRRYGTAGIDVLLHEATFDDDDRLQCDTKRHSTVSDAIEVSERVGAGRTLLTHFSQRYSSSSRRSRRNTERLGSPCHDSDAPRVMDATDGLQIKLF
jgi:ribonuclease BN (tRNA processing enzyme)